MLAFPAGVEAEAEAHTQGSWRRDTAAQMPAQQLEHHLAQVIRANMLG